MFAEGPPPDCSEQIGQGVLRDGWRGRIIGKDAVVRGREEECSSQSRTAMEKGCGGEVALGAVVAAGDY